MLVIPSTATAILARAGWWTPCTATKLIASIASPRGLTYNGLWDWGQSKAGVYYEKTNNTRLQEGSTGRVEGMINSEDYATSRLESPAYYLGIKCAFLLAGGPDADAGNGMEP